MQHDIKYVKGTEDSTVLDNNKHIITVTKTVLPANNEELKADLSKITIYTKSYTIVDKGDGKNINYSEKSIESSFHLDYIGPDFNTLKEPGACREMLATESPSSTRVSLADDITPSTQPISPDVNPKPEPTPGTVILKDLIPEEILKNYSEKVVKSTEQVMNSYPAELLTEKVATNIIKSVNTLTDGYDVSTAEEINAALSVMSYDYSDL